MKFQIALLAAAAVLSSAGDAAAGVVLTTKGSEAKSNEESTIYLEGNKMRVESKKDSDHQTVIIYDGDRQTMITVDPEKKTFTEVTPAKIKALTADAQKKMQEHVSKMTPEQKKQMDAAMAQMPPEQRQRMQEMMAGRMPSQDSVPAGPPAKWERTGSEQKVAGYSCQGFKEIKDGKTQATGCFIPWSSSSLTKADIAPLMKMQEFATQAGWGAVAQRGLAELANAPGFPGVWERIGDDGQGHDRTTLTSVKRSSVSADKFQPPAGFTKSELPTGQH